MNEGEEISFIDLYSGVGGFRRGLERANHSRYEEDGRPQILQEGCTNTPIERLEGTTQGYRCVWSCDWNKYANQVYTKHFGEENHHSGDIRGVDPGDIPDFDLLCAGFPCQSFSVAGKGKGFQDTRGTLFFEISRIAEAKRPQMLLLENVRGLLSNDRGQTFQTILQELGRIGYWAEWQVLNSKHHGVPQNRERVFIIGHLRGTGGREIFPIAEDGGLPEPPRGETLPTLTGTDYKGPSKQRATALVLDTFNRGIKEGEAYALKTNPSPTSSAVVALRKVGDVYESGADAGRIYSPEGVARTLKGKAGGLGGKTGLYTDNFRIRRLTPVECERLQGFPNGWTELGYIYNTDVLLYGNVWEISAQLKDATVLSLIESQHYALCTIRDGESGEIQISHLETYTNHSLKQNADTVIGLARVVQRECVCDTINLGKDTVILYSLNETNKVEEITQLSLIRERMEEQSTSPLWKITLDENCEKEKLHTISTWIKKIIESKIYIYARTGKLITDVIIHLSKLQENLLNGGLLVLKTVNTTSISDTQRYRALGNAVTVPVITFLGKRIMETARATPSGVVQLTQIMESEE